MEKNLRNSEKIIKLASKREDLFFVILATSLVVAKFGYTSDMGANHPLQMVVVHKILNPSLYPNDAFVEQTWFAYTSVLWPLFAYLLRWFDFESLSVVSFLMNRILIVLAVIYAANSIFDKKKFAYLAAILTLTSFPNAVIGDGFPIKNYVEQTSFAFAFGLISLAALIRQKGWIVAFALGATFCFNSMYGIFAVVYLSATIVGVKQLRNGWARWLSWVVAGCLLGMPGWIPTVLVGRMPYEEVAAWKVSEITYPYHFYLIKMHQHLRFLLIVLITVLALKYFTILNVFIKNILYCWTLVALFWYVLAIVFPFFVSPSLLRLHPIRGQEFWHLFAVMHLWGTILTASLQWLSHRLEVGKVTRLLNAVFLLAAVGLGVSPEIKRSLQGWSMFSSNRTSDLRRIAEWARQHTQIDDVFIVPINEYDWARFRHLSQRNVYLHWRDGYAWTYAIWYSSEFLQRLRDIGFFDKVGLDESRYQRWDWVLRKQAYILHSRFQIEEEDVVRVAKKYRIDYWILPKKSFTTFPVVYEGESVIVVKVPDLRKQIQSKPRQVPLQSDDRLCFRSI